MDSLTQATLGAAVGQAVLGHKIGNKAPALGALIGTLPDLDVLLVPFLDPLEKISIHRGYSHSILFCIASAIILGVVLKRLKWTARMDSFSLVLVSFLCLFTHILLDAITTYGTQLFLPFTDWRVSFDSINIIDPVYTIPLLAGVLISAYQNWNNSRFSGRFNTLGLILSSMYLVFTLAHKQHIESVFVDQLESQSKKGFELLTVPVRIGNMHWYGVAKTPDELYIGKYSSIDKNKINFHRFPINEALLEDLDNRLVEKMKWFAQGFYTVAEADGRIRIYNMQCDMQGVRQFRDYKAPTAFYFEIEHKENGGYDLSSGMHRDGKIE